MEAEDEWLLQSLRLYRDLHTFELQAPTRVIEWARGSRVCVAGYGQSGGNEILQLIPPPALQAKETQGLCPERDFKVECGGFSKRPVYSLKYVPDTSLLVTSGPPDSSLQVWQVSAEDSDVIKSVGTIATENATGQPWAKIATISARAPWVLHGSTLDSVQITEVELRKKVYTAGFDGTVHVYDTQSWDSSGREAEPVFVHKGHALEGSGDPALVTVHTWHPQKPRTVLSAATDGSLHVWDWVQP